MAFASAMRVVSRGWIDGFQRNRSLIRVLIRKTPWKAYFGDWLVSGTGMTVNWDLLHHVICQFQTQSVSINVTRKVRHGGKIRPMLVGEAPSSSLEMAHSIWLEWRWEGGRRFQ